ncbi:hypothetical protein BDAP_000170 [Binucleata daphniae]
MTDNNTIQTICTQLQSSLNSYVTNLRKLNQDFFCQTNQGNNKLTQEINTANNKLISLQNKYKECQKERAELQKMLNDDQVELYNFEKENTNIYNEILNLKNTKNKLKKEITGKINEIEMLNMSISQEEKRIKEKEEDYRKRSNYLRNVTGFDVIPVEKNVCNIVMIVNGKECSLIVDFEKGEVKNERPSINANEIYSEDFYSFVKKARQRFESVYTKNVEQ